MAVEQGVTMTTYSWKEVECAAYPEMSGQVDVVYMVSGTLCAVAPNGGSAEERVTSGIPYGDLSAFTALAEVTKEQAVGWLEAALSPDTFDGIKTRLATNAATRVVKRFGD